jgi:hypothetical protein
MGPGEVAASRAADAEMRRQRESMKHQDYNDCAENVSH